MKLLFNLKILEFTATNHGNVINVVEVNTLIAD